MSVLFSDMPTSAEPTSQPSFSGLHTLGHYPPALVTPGTASNNQRQLLCPQTRLPIQSLPALLLLLLPRETTGPCPQRPSSSASAPLGTSHCSPQWAASLNTAAKEGLTEKVIPQERPEGGKGESRSDNCEKSSPGTGKSKCKGPEVRRGCNWLTLAVGRSKGFQGRRATVVIWAGLCSSPHPPPGPTVKEQGRVITLENEYMQSFQREKNC